MTYIFEKPLQEAMILTRKSQFTVEVQLLNWEIVKAHCPTTWRIGDIELKQISCLLSESDDPKRKLKYTLEAVSCDAPNAVAKKRIGINQILSNRLVEHFIKNGDLASMLEGKTTPFKREVKLGISKLDFLVDKVYIEVKTPLTTLNVQYSSHIKTKPITPFSSTERFTKHIRELAGALQENERAILLTVQQYQTTLAKPHQRSTHYEEVKAAVDFAVSRGVEIWHMELEFCPDAVKFLSCENQTALLRWDQN